MLMTTVPVFAESIISLDEIVVYGTLAETELWKTGSSSEKINSNKLETTGSTSVTTIMKALPGITTTQSGAYGGTTYLSIRGLPSAYIKPLKDGIDISDPSAIKTEFGDLGELTTHNVSSIEVLKGTQSAIYGSSAVAGVMAITTLDLEGAVDGIQQTFNTSIGSNKTTSGSYSFTQVDSNAKLGIAISGFQTQGLSASSVRTIDDITGKPNHEKDSFESRSITLGATVNLNENLEIGAKIFTEKSDAEYDEMGGADYDTAMDGTFDERKTRDSLGATTFVKYKTSGWEHKFSLSSYEIKRYSTSPTTGPNGLAITNRYKGKRQSAQYVASGHLTNSISLSFGFDTEKETSHSNSLVGDIRSTTTNGAFFETQYLATDRLAFMANFRRDAHDAFGNFDSYRVSSSYKLSEQTVVRVMQSTGFRSPSMEELYSYYPSTIPAYVFYGNKDLKPESFKSNELTLNHTFANSGIISMSLFETFFDDRIQSTLNSYENSAKQSSIKGSEISINAPLGETTDFSLAFTSLTKNQMAGDRSAGQTVSLSINQHFSDKLSGNIQVISVTDQPSKGTKPRHDYKILNLGLNYNLYNNLGVYGKIENAGDYFYETEPGFTSLGRTLTVGISASF